MVGLHLDEELMIPIRKLPTGDALINTRFNCPAGRKFVIVHEEFREHGFG